MDDNGSNMADGEGAPIVIMDEDNDMGPRRSKAKRRERAPVEDDNDNDPQQSGGEESGGEEDEGDNGGSEPPTKQMWYQPPEEKEEEDDAETRVRRLLRARAKRRRRGRVLRQEQIDEDMDEVKEFLKLGEEEQRAYLLVYEQDDTDERILRGLTRSCSLGMKLYLSHDCPDDADLVQKVIDRPEIQDSIASLIDLAELQEFKQYKAVRAVAALGTIGDLLYANLVTAKKVVSEIAAIRRNRQAERSSFQRDEPQQQQSVFQFNAAQTNVGVAQGEQRKQQQGPVVQI